MKKREKVLLLFVILSCGILFGGCRTGKSEQKNEKSGVVLTLAHCWADREVIDEIVGDYNRLHSGLTVEVEYIPVEQYVTSLKNRSAAGELPDIYMGWPGSSMEWFYQNGLALDLSGETWVDRLDERTRDDVTYGSEVRMLPMNKTFICFGYNKELFERSGIGTPGNYEEFLVICEKLKSEGVMPIALGSRDSSGYIYPSWMMAVSDIYAFDPEYDQKLYEGTEKMSDRWGMILERQREWMEKGYVDQNHLAADRMSDSLDVFVEGNAGMFVLGSWEIENIFRRMETMDSHIDMGFFPMPSVSDSGILVCASGEGFCVNSQSLHPEEALSVIDYFTRKEANERFQNSMNSFSTFEDLSLEYNEVLSEIRLFVDGRPTWGYPDAAWPRKIGDKFAELFPQYLAGKLSEEAFLRRLDMLWGREPL